MLSYCLGFESSLKGSNEKPVVVKSRAESNILVTINSKRKTLSLMIALDEIVTVSYRNATFKRCMACSKRDGTIMGESLSCPTTSKRLANRFVFGKAL